MLTGICKTSMTVRVRTGVPVHCRFGKHKTWCGKPKTVTKYANKSELSNSAVCFYLDSWITQTYEKFLCQTSTRPHPPDRKQDDL